MRTIKKTPMYKPSQSIKSEQGFTMLEIVIALVLMMIVVLGAAALFGYAINYNSGAYDRTLAHAVAQRQMEYLRRVPYANLTTPAQPEPNIISSGRPFSIVTTICADAAANCGGSATLKKITIDITPLSGAVWVRNPVHLESFRAAPTTGPYF
jgi:Tfp pilus assembly protein PilV